MNTLRRQAFLKLNRLLGSHCETCYRELFAWEQLDRETLLRRRDARVETLLGHAAKAIPFYRDRVSGKGELSLDDFPVLTRKDLRLSFRDLMGERIRREYDGKAPRQRRYSWVSSDTGGSTGVPTTVIHDSDFRDFDRAARMYAMHLCGFPFGTPYFRLWGSMKDINQMQASWPHRLTARFAGEVMLNAFRMETKDMTGYTDRIRHSGPRHLMGYVDAVYELARHVQRENLDTGALETVMACGGTVTAEMRDTIETVFSARVHNKYGSRDCGDMACECSEGGIHIFANRYRVEAVDDNGRPVPSGEVGRLLITVLGNHGFPLIRYDIGDMGALSDATCSCGRGFPLLSRVEGRTMEFLKSTTGGHVSPVYIRHLLGVVHNPGNLRRFQLVQEDAVRFTLKLQWDPGVDEAQTRESTHAILRDLKQVLGADAQISVESVDAIAETQSGKFLATICRLKTE